MRPLFWRELLITGLPVIIDVRPLALGLAPLVQTIGGRAKAPARAVQPLGHRKPLIRADWPPVPQSFKEKERLQDPFADRLTEPIDPRLGRRTRLTPRDMLR